MRQAYSGPIFSAGVSALSTMPPSSLSSSSPSTWPLWPLREWTELALKTQEMLLSSGTVIRLRTERIAQAGLAPSADDLVEFRRMGDEKLEAAHASGFAMARQWHSSQIGLASRICQQCLHGAAAFLSLAGSVTPAQAAEHGDALIRAASRAAHAAQRWPNSTARIASEGLKPIHAVATANARRLGAQAEG